MGFLFFTLLLSQIGAAWSPAISASPPSSLQVAQPLVITSQNGTVAIWLGYDTNGSVVVRGSNIAGTTWTTPVDLSLTGEDASSLHLGLDSNGHAVAIWLRSDGANERVQATYFDGFWPPASSSVYISPPGKTASQPQLHMDLTGNAVATWSSFDGTSFTIESSTFSP